ncbi:MAG: hypothetical protein ACK5V3_01735 [Bdellovibrionales bacterium]
MKLTQKFKSSSWEKWMIRLVALFATLAIHGIAMKSFSATPDLAKPFCELKSLIVNSESVKSLSDKLNQLVADGRCVVKALPCEVKTESFSSRALAKYQIAVADMAKFGASTTQQLFDAVMKLKSVGICQNE